MIELLTSNYLCTRTFRRTKMMSTILKLNTVDVRPPWMLVLAKELAPALRRKLIKT